MRGQIGAGGFLPGRISARARPTRRRFLGAGGRYRSTQGRQIDVLPTAIARFASRPRRATVSKQREDVEHACVLEVPGSTPSSVADPKSGRLEWAEPGCQSRRAMAASPIKMPQVRMRGGARQHPHLFSAELLFSTGLRGSGGFRGPA